MHKAVRAGKRPSSPGLHGKMKRNTKQSVLPAGKDFISMKILDQLVRKISKNQQLCFFSGLLFGFLTHLFMMTNKLSNWDDLSNFNSYGVGGELGRWVLRFIHPLAGKLSNPWINGSMAILLISITCVMLYGILRLETRMAAVLLPMIFMTFPSLCSTMTFMFTVDLYAIGLFLAVLAVWLSLQWKWGFLPAMGPLILSLGIYQAYICFTISLLLIRWLQDEIRDSEENKKCKVKETLCRGLRYVIMLGAGVLIYIIIAHLRYPLLSQETHNGVGNMGKINPLRVPVYCAKAYLRLIRYFLLGSYSFQTGFVKVMNIAAVILLVVMMAVVLYRVKILQDKLRGLWTLFLLLALPVALSFIDVMSPDAYFSMLMIYQFCLVYVLLLCLGEKLEKDEKGKNMAGRFLSLAGILVVLATGYSDYIITGEAYFRMKLSYERVYSYFERMITRVENQPGYDAEDKLIILGSFDEETINDFSLEEERFYDLSGVALEYGLITSGTRERFLQIYLGKTAENSMDENAQSIRDSQEYKTMSDYPSDGCIKKIGDTWVVRISE